VHQIQTSFYQQITWGQRNTRIGAIRPHLLVFNKPGLSGTAQVQIQDTRGRAIATSETLNIPGLSTLAYAHKYYRFRITAALRKSETYRLAVILGGGYSFSESAYVAWCNGWDLRPRSPSYSPASGFLAPLDYEVWSKEEIRRGDLGMGRVLDF